ncbi:terminase large subunit domain-containing protein [Plantibacter sp. YIM 135347]|uniref:terminase large subunit domain-containing protein n=1 Tax=Plantibacter sp. YIM 135347 TaxID=3423919 RepID=UPI003D330B8D
MSGWGVAAPVRCTPPLSENYTSDADWFLPIVIPAWQAANPGATLDRWQRELIRRVLETYPPGHSRAGQLRFRQVVISLARQNGKSVIGAILGLYGLMFNMVGAYVIGIASSSEQARIIYDRTMSLIRRNKALARLFAKLTDTRGIQALDGAKYEIKAAKSASLQGLAISLGIVDELHILAQLLWNDLVNGLGGRPNGLVVGITTAGDDNSELLISLYQTGAKAIEGDPELERFGFFVWEAPEAKMPDTRDEVIAYLLAANPFLAEGRGDLEAVLSDIASQPPQDVIRYRFNRFTAAESSFLSLDLWLRCQRPEDAAFPVGRPVFAVDRSPDWGYASIVAGIKTPDGIIHTELVASITRPTLAQLVDVCVALNAHMPERFVLDGYSLKELGNELVKRGMTVYKATQGDNLNAAALLYSKIKQRKIMHAGDALLLEQMPRAVRKNVGEHFRISRSGSSVEIDGVIATSLVVLATETQRESELQIF